MERISNILKSNEKIIGYSLIGSCVIAGLNCLERPDYNLFLYLFIYYTMLSSVHTVKIQPSLQRNERMLATYVFAISMIIDILWVIFYKGSGLQIAMILSYIEIGIKFLLLFALVVMWQGTKTQGLLDSNQKDIEGQAQQKDGFNAFKDEQ